MDLSNYTTDELKVIASLLVDAAATGRASVDDLRDEVLADLAGREVAASYETAL